MPINSQFLYFYTDELIRGDWVEWTETAFLSTSDVAASFQDQIGDHTANPRTRAGEAYRTGLLRGRLVPQRSGADDGAPGWEMVLAGDPPLTRLGLYAYLAGSALQESGPETPRLQAILSDLAVLQILHIGFEYDAREYSTVLVFQFVRAQIEQVLNRPLSAVEIRYLAAAVFNTLDFDNPALILDPYAQKTSLGSLSYHFEDGGAQYFEAYDLPQQVEKYGINAFKKTKGPLFWSHTRGIFTRSNQSVGFRLLQRLTEIDRRLAHQGAESFTSALTRATRRARMVDVFELLEAQVPQHPELIVPWDELKTSLSQGISALVSSKELDAASLVWQEAVRRTEGAAVPIEKSGTHADEQANTLAAESALSGTPEDYDGKVAESFGETLIAAPSVHGPASPMKPLAVKADFAERDARNRALGKAGEAFIIAYEREKLRRWGLGDLVAEVVWASDKFGDGLGYDIMSYDEDRSRIFIEVKTTNGAVATPFYISANELLVSREFGSKFRLYRVFDFKLAPKFYQKAGALDEGLRLQATTYRAYPAPAADV